VLNPDPLTVELADRVVNAPDAGVVPPIAPGEGKEEVDPPNDTDVPPIVIAELVRLKTPELYVIPVPAIPAGSSTFAAEAALTLKTLVELPVSVVVPLVVHCEIPPKTVLLYWSCPAEPPGDEPAPPQAPPESSMVVEFRNEAQWPLVIAPKVVTPLPPVICASAAQDRTTKTASTFNVRLTI
jgi:hypothetical protein